MDYNNSQNNLMEVYGLGRFTVIYNNQKIDIKNWSSNKAVKLFKFFIINRDKEIYKEELIKNFWPDVDFKTGEKRIYNTIYLLRKNIGIKKIIVNNHSRYRLNNNFSLWIDWEEFLDLYNCCNKDPSVENLKKAVELYKGDLLPALKNEKWVVKIRDNLKEKYLDLVYKLSKKLYDEEEYLEALNYLNMGINKDIYREDYYNLAMKILAKTCKAHEALLLYQKYKKLLENDLGISPSQNIKQTYLNLNNLNFELDDFETQAKNKGALVCSKEGFENIFKLEKRRINRNYENFTILEIDFTKVKLREFDFNNLTEEIALLFRVGDVICCCNNKVKILLHNMNMEKTNYILDRIFEYLKIEKIEGIPEFDFKEITLS